MRKNLLSSSIDMIICKDAENKAEKEIPVKHFYIDFRNMILKPKLEQLLGGNFEEGPFDLSRVKSNGFTLY
jgi:hypothetical protein